VTAVTVTACGVDHQLSATADVTFDNGFVATGAELVGPQLKNALRGKGLAVVVDGVTYPVPDTVHVDLTVCGGGQH
jgi:hypothetical protein